jgi:hypothetical protein
MHLSCCARYPGMCKLPHFSAQYMCALCHEMCIQNDIKTTHQLKYIFIYITIGFGLGILQSPPLIYALSSVHHVPIYNKISKILKKMWVFCPHCILMLPSSILRTVPGPLDLYKPYGSIQSCLIFRSRMCTGCT